MNISKSQLSKYSKQELLSLYNVRARKLEEEELRMFKTKQEGIERTHRMIMDCNAIGVLSSKKPDIPPEPLPEPKKRESGRSASHKGKRIFSNVMENPRRNGTHGYKSMQIIIDNPGILFEKFIEEGGRSKDLSWDLKHDNVALD
jgi:hypothetical protein